MSRISRLEVVVLALLLVLSLALRLTDLNAFIASDELKWTCRSLGFREALANRDWAGTFRVGHPGVITTWLGALALPADVGGAVETCQRTEDAGFPARAGVTPEEQTQRMAELGRLLFQARTGIALFTWLCLLAVWVLTRRALGPGVALAGVAMLGLDPFLLAHSRFLHLDAVTAMLSLVAVAALLAVGLGTEPRRRLLLLLSGGVAGLAMLEKSPALFLAPFAALVLAAAALSHEIENPHPWRRWVADLAVWSLVAGVVYVVLWPAMWVDPLGTLQRMLAKAVGYAQEGHESGSFFFGDLGEDPGPLFYPVALAFRLTPVSLIGIGAALVALLSGRRLPKSAAAAGDVGPAGFVSSNRLLRQATLKDFGSLVARLASRIQGEQRALLILLVYATGFVVFMTTGAKKFDRYLLPALAALDLVAAVGLVWLGRLLVRSRGASVVPTGEEQRSGGGWPSRPVLMMAPAVLVALLQLAVALPAHPYYLTAYNPLLGGARAARKVILVGWGEGYDQAAAYLNAQTDAQQAQATVRGVSNFAPLFAGETRSVDGYHPWQSDYLVFYVSDVQRLHNEDLMQRYYFNPDRQPEHVVKLAGVDYAWIYRNDNWRAPLDRVAHEARPGDALMTNGTSLLAQHYQGDLPRLDVYGHWGASETLELLNELPADVQRIWYARYTQADPAGIQQTLHQRAVLEAYQAYPDLELYLYRLVDLELQPLETAIAYTPAGGDARLQLVATAISDGQLRWGQDNLIRLGWQAPDGLQNDYRIRLRLTGADGYIWAEMEEPLLDQALQPASAWTGGAEITSAHRLEPPAGMPPGLYDLSVEVLQPVEVSQAAGQVPAPEVEAPVQSSSPAQTPVRVGEPARPITVDDLDLGQRIERRIGSLTLLGARFESDVAEAGGSLPVRLTWQMPDAPPANQRLRVELRGLNGTTWGTWAGKLPANATGLVRTGHNLRIALDVSGGAAQVFVAPADESGAEALEVGQVAVVATEPSFEVPAQVRHPRDERLGDAVRFLGYDSSTQSLAPGETLGLTLYWQAGGPISPPQKVFVHLLGPDGQIYGQKDNPPLVGRHPTDRWQAGEVVADPYLVPLDPDAPPGDYTMTIGMYDPNSGDRLPAFDAEGNRLPDDRIVLGQMEVR